MVLPFNMLLLKPAHFEYTAQFVSWFVNHKRISCYEYASQRYKSDTALGTYSGTRDVYNGVTIDTRTERCQFQYFSKKLEGYGDGKSRRHPEAEISNNWIHPSTSHYTRRLFETDGDMQLTNSEEVTILSSEGKTKKKKFRRDDFVMMYKWLPEDSKPSLPPSAHTNVGVCAMVINQAKQLLAISEKHYNYPHLKLPGGYVERGEDLIHAAVREVKEETGIDTCFHSLVTVRHGHNSMFGNSELNAFFILDALSEQICVSEEIASCIWMDIEDFKNHPLVNDFTKMIVKKGLDMKSRNIKFDVKEKKFEFATIIRHIKYIFLEGLD